MASRYPYHHQNFPSRASNMGMPPVTMGLATQQPHVDIGNMTRFPGLVPGMWNQPVPGQRWIPPQQQQQRPNWNEQQLKEREYLKQQQKLRAMSYSNKKSPVTADALIENLLGQKDTFVLKKNDEIIPEKKIIPDGTIANGSTEVKMPVRKSQAPIQTTASHQRISPPNESAVSSNSSDKELVVHPNAGSVLPTYGFPAWATGVPGMPLPLMYDRIWEAVGCPMGSGLADTGLLFPLLLTSGLQREVLGHIWALCNRTVPGRLTRAELNVCLALIALAQNGHPFTNLSVLETTAMTQPPIPNLDLSTLPPSKHVTTPEVTNTIITPSIPVFPATNRADLNAPLIPTVSSATSPQLPQNNSKVSQEDEWDDFTEFQSASNTVLDNPVEPLHAQPPDSIKSQNSSDAFNSSCPSSKSEMSCGVNLNQQNSVVSSTIPLPLPTQGNRLLSAESSPVMSSKSSSERRGIGSRLANHTLGAPALSNQCNPSSKNPEPSEEDDYDDFCEFRSGPPASEHSEGTPGRKLTEQESEMLDNLFPRCSVRPPFRTEILRESAIRSEPLADDIFSIPKDSKSSGNQEASPGGLDTWVDSLQFPSTPSTIPKKGNDFKIAAQSVSEVKVTTPTAPVDEDRYSALRELAAEINPPQNAPAKEEDDEDDDDDDDFGDFLSARGTPAAPVSEDSFSEIARDSALNKESESTDDPFKILVSSDPQPVNATNWSADFSAFEVGQVPNREINNNVAVPGNDDDFGDFVGGDRDEAIDSLRIEGGWLGSDRRGEGGSIGTGEASPDSRSINAVAMEGDGNMGGRGRTGSLPSLDLKGFSMLGVGEGEGSSGEEGDGSGNGDSRRNYSSPVGGEKCVMEQWEPSKSAGQHAYEWRRCLASCLSLLQSALLIFSSISSGEVIEEVVSTEEGEDYLSNLLEVYWVSRRIAASYQQLDLRDSQLDSLLDDIGAVWEGLMPFYEKSGIMEVEYNLDLRSSEGVWKAHESGVNCGVCLVVVPPDGDEVLSQSLVYGGHHYHTTCANLWVNCVDRLLPSLQYISNTV
ncbi:synergin gamma-like isoform X2 [Ischnura elegans]|uniref:synergin gamma-like isoform X2 n=1 Tax=Ischnura elegans TaxID=197161 RepID=UPI001ED874DD|nr:synergin gamma-like isoform X2 [Ischnura elegans]